MVGKKLFLALLLALLPALASAQGPSSAQIEANKGNLKQVNVADLTNANKSLMYRVMDGASADDCTVGSGTVQVPCYWDGTTWTAANGSGGSGDVTAVGDCASGACFAGATGTTLTFNNAGGDGILSYDGTDFAFDKPIDVTGTIGLSSTLTLPDNVRQTFNPGADAAGLNVGSQAGDPGTPANGDIWYDSVGNTLDARINGATVSLGAGGGAPTDATYITQTANGSLSNEQALGALATGCLGSTTTTGVVAARTITGTSNEVSLANGDCSGNPTVSLPATIDLGGKTSFEIPNSAAPTTDAFGEVAGDNDAWAASRGAPQWFDGTANTYLIGTVASDAPSNGECPKWNTGGTITWENCAGGGISGLTTGTIPKAASSTSIDDSRLIQTGNDVTAAFGTGTAAAKIGGWLYADATSTAGSTSDGLQHTFGSGIGDYTLPANSLSAAGKGVRITGAVQFTTGATLTVYLMFGSTQIAKVAAINKTTAAVIECTVLRSSGASAQTSFCKALRAEGGYPYNSAVEGAVNADSGWVINETTEDATATIAIQMKYASATDASLVVYKLMTVEAIQ